MNNETRPMCDKTETKVSHTGHSPSLLDRLYEKRRQHEEQIYRINNSIRVLEANSALVEIVEIVLLSEQKAADPLPWR